VGRAQLGIEHFPGIHPIIGIERLLDGAHDIERRAMLGFHVLHLAVADTVLAGAGPTHRQRAPHQLLVQPAGLVDLGGIVGIDQVHQVEVAISRMPDQANRE